MVQEQLINKGIRDSRVLEAFRRVPRHEFVPVHLQDRAYDDGPLPIGAQQTISQPYIVAFMLETLALKGGEKVLEIGTGSGYETALLCALATRVFSIERLPDLALQAEGRLERLGYRVAGLRTGDGSRGWPEEAPFDRIVVSAGSPRVPESLLQQLAEKGILVVPVGGETRQELHVVTRRDGKVSQRTVCPCVFVKLIGEEGWDDSSSDAGS